MISLKINIFYFSGTGFTERVGKGLTKEFVDLGQETNLYYIPDFMAKEPAKKLDEVDDSGMIGIMYPVHSFNAPEIVINFARKLPRGNGRKAFIVKTAGDKANINSGSSLLLIKTLEKRGYLVEYEELVQMPTNFLVRYDNDFIRKLVREAEDLVKIIAEEIIKGRKKKFQNGVGKHIFSTAARMEWFGAHILAKFHFKVHKSCNLCGICIKDCPVKNIQRHESQIKFGLDCTFCMRCIYACPQKAIHIRQPFSAIEVKDWFDLDELMKEKSE